MKQDAKPDQGDEPERDELREMLRHWQVPGAPPEIEEGLRRAFRGRRAPPRRALWLSLAACVALVLTWQMRPGDPPVRPAVAPRPAPPAAAQPLPGLTVDLGQSARSASVAVTPARTRRHATRTPTQPEVVVEPAQAELLAQLGRDLWKTRQAAPGTTIPQMPDVEVPRYRQEWEAVAGEWPLVQQSVPIGER